MTREPKVGNFNRLQVLKVEKKATSYQKKIKIVSCSLKQHLHILAPHCRASNEQKRPFLLLFSW